MSEGELYERQGDLDGVAKLYSWEDVKIGSSIDSTELARRGISVDEDGEPVSLEAKYRVECIADEEHAKGYRCWDCRVSVEEVDGWTNVLEPEDQAVAVRHRVHCRLLLKSLGRPITDFCSLRELIEVFIDAIKGMCRSHCLSSSLDS